MKGVFMDNKLFKRIKELTELQAISGNERQVREYMRDKAAGLEPNVPVNYFPDDDPTKEPVVKWRGHANLIYSNWLNYYVYQTTPYDINTIG